MAADPPATIGFDWFVSLYVNYRPMFGVDAGAIESAFAALGAGAGESVERGSLLETLSSAARRCRARSSSRLRRSSWDGAQRWRT